MNLAERETHVWWAVADGDVVKVLGYSCRPTNPGMWWCPQVGYTLSEKCHLFDTEKEALGRCIEEVNRDLEFIKSRIESLKLRLASLP